MFTGPNLINTDVSLRKTFRVTESKSFVFSADMFNAFNRTNFSAPTVLNAFTTTGAPNTGLGGTRSDPVNLSVTAAPGVTVTVAPVNVPSISSAQSRSFR